MKEHLICMFFLAIIGCSSTEKDNRAEEAESAPTSIQKQIFGMANGQEVFLFSMKNASGLMMEVTNYGGFITSLKTPDRDGQYADVVLGYDNLKGYLERGSYFGSIVGRYGNRIADAKFSLDGQEYILAKNNGPNSLHGGIKGFDKVIWEAESMDTNAGPSLKLTYTSPHLEEGFPGNLATEVTYTLSNNDELLIEYRATTDQPTIVNLTNHTYFNFSGGKQDILDHQVQLAASQYIPVDSSLIPLGNLEDVAGTPLDFTQAYGVGERIEDGHSQIQLGHGYDHCWVLDKSSDLGRGGSVYHPSSGRYMEFLTSEPGVQFYSGNFLNGSVIGKGGQKYKRRWGLCLETQHFPDSPNQPDFPSTELRPGEEYRSTTIYRFSVR